MAGRAGEACIGASPNAAERRCKEKVERTCRVSVGYKSRVDKAEVRSNEIVWAEAATADLCMSSGGNAKEPRSTAGTRRDPNSLVFCSILSFCNALSVQFIHIECAPDQPLKPGRLPEASTTRSRLEWPAQTFWLLRHRHGRSSCHSGPQPSSSALSHR